MTKYTVTLDTPKGTFDVELLASSPDLAAKRAYWTLVHHRYGDLDEVTVVEVIDMETGIVNPTK